MCTGYSIDVRHAMSAIARKGVKEVEDDVEERKRKRRSRTLDLRLVEPRETKYYLQN
jgi:hypothetical protein